MYDEVGFHRLYFRNVFVSIFSWTEGWDQSWDEIFSLSVTRYHYTIPTRKSRL